MKRLIPATLTSVLAACATPVPEPESVGAQAFVTRCGGCHALPHPARHSASQWPHVLSLMELRMQERAYAPMSEQERDEILAYLQRNAR